MQYLILLYTDPEDWAAKPKAEIQAVIRDHEKLIEELRAGGKYLNSNALEPTTAATSIRVREGRTLVTDGPFAETREQLGGYYLVDAKDLDDALAIAARIPDAAVGCIEIRPVRDVGI